MRGGKRPGAGRKPSEPTKMVRVPLIDEAEIKQADTPVPFDKDALRSLERVPKDVQRQLKSDYGSLTNAVKAGIRAQRYDGKWRAVLPG